MTWHKHFNHHSLLEKLTAHLNMRWHTEKQGNHMCATTKYSVSYVHWCNRNINKIHNWRQQQKAVCKNKLKNQVIKKTIEHDSNKIFSVLMINHNLIWDNMKNIHTVSASYRLFWQGEKRILCHQFPCSDFACCSSVISHACSKEKVDLRSQRQQLALII